MTGSVGSHLLLGYRIQALGGEIHRYRAVEIWGYCTVVFRCEIEEYVLFSSRGAGRVRTAQMKVKVQTPTTTTTRTITLRTTTFRTTTTNRTTTSTESLIKKWQT